MKIAIIGAGFTGLSAGYTLSKLGHKVTIFEKDQNPGGLAIGFRNSSWKWTLERHYHHWFTSDNFVLDLAKEINFPVIIKRPKTSVFVKGKLYQLDSPLAFLTFPLLSLVDRLRMLVTLGCLRINPFWKPLEKVRAVPILLRVMGETAWNMLWFPQLKNKMGEYTEDISLVWFWTRITKRTPSLAYPEGGFLPFAQSIVEAIERNGGEVKFETETLKIADSKQVTISYKENAKTKKGTFDKVIVTLPSFLFLKVTPGLPKRYQNKLVRLRGLSATNLVLRLKKPFFKDGTYWLSVCELGSPIMAIIEHTNFMDKKYFGGEHLVYLGNYATTHDKLEWSKEKILKFYDPFLQKIHPEYKKDLIGFEFFKAPFAQPIVPTNYSKLVPPMTTPLPNVFLANIEQVYPWDRGTNYAVELGEKVAKIISSQ